MEKNLQPNTLDEILALRPKASIKTKKPDDLKNRIYAAWSARCAGCTMGVPVENWKIEDMRALAKNSGTEFPPDGFWKEVTEPDRVQYGVNKRSEYTRAAINKVPVDDDITYTALNLILLEKYGKNYAVEDVAELWLEILPVACTAEDEALKELKKGTPAKLAAEYNDYVEWIGAAIRADAFGYADAGNPEAAAIAAYNDAYLTHRRNGIYGEMFAAAAIAAAIAAAFTAKTPLDAVKAGMTQIPETSELYSALDFAVNQEGKLKDYAHARAILDEKFNGMHCVHTINNMCAVVFALILGGNDAAACISNSVAIGLDNDCNAATVGSITGACLGLKTLPKSWYEPFNDRVCTYLKGYPEFSLSDMAERFYRLNPEETDARQ